MKIAIVYSSITGNTKELISILRELFLKYNFEISESRIDEFPLANLSRFDAIVIGTYTWGNGEIPDEMVPLYKAFENQDVKNIVTGVAGTGDQFYPNFCGAVDEFRDMLYVHTRLAATLKVELVPQQKDLTRCHKFVELIYRCLTTHEISAKA